MIRGFLLRFVLFFVRLLLPKKLKYAEEAALAMGLLHRLRMQHSAYLIHEGMKHIGKTLNKGKLNKGGKKRKRKKG